MDRPSDTPPAPPQSAPDRFALGGWRVDASLDEVAGHGQVHKLEPRTMRLLLALARARGGVVRADDLLDAVWPGLVVTPSSLYDAVAQLRKVLGPDHIATVPRKGYRLVPPVRPEITVSPASIVAASEVDQVYRCATPSGRIRQSQPRS